MRYVWRHGWVPKRHFVRMPTAPIIITDTCTPFRSMADGRMYESKAAYRADLRARGMVETAGCNLPERPPQEPALTAEAIAEAYDHCEADHGARPPDRPPDGWQGNVIE